MLPLHLLPLPVQPQMPAHPALTSVAQILAVGRAVPVSRERCAIRRRGSACAPSTALAAAVAQTGVVGSVAPLAPVPPLVCLVPVFVLLSALVVPVEVMDVVAFARPVVSPISIATSKGSVSAIPPSPRLSASAPASTVDPPLFLDVPPSLVELASPLQLVSMEIVPRFAYRTVQVATAASMGVGEYVAPAQSLGRCATRPVSASRAPLAPLRIVRSTGLLLSVALTAAHPVVRIVLVALRACVPATTSTQATYSPVGVRAPPSAVVFLTVLLVSADSQVVKIPTVPMLELVVAIALLARSVTLLDCVCVRSTARVVRAVPMDAVARVVCALDPKISARLMVHVNVSHLVLLPVPMEPSVGSLMAALALPVDSAMRRKSATKASASPIAPGAIPEARILTQPSLPIPQPSPLSFCGESLTRQPMLRTI